MIFKTIFPFQLSKLGSQVKLSKKIKSSWGKCPHFDYVHHTFFRLHFCFQVGGELERIFGTTAVGATKTEPEPNLSTDLSTPAGRPSRKAKTAADKNRAIILKTLKAFEDDLDADTLLAEDDAEEDEEAMYVTGDVSAPFFHYTSYMLLVLILLEF